MVLTKKTKLAPIRVQNQLNKPANKACITGDREEKLHLIPQ